MNTDLMQLTESERVKILQKPTEAAELKPPKPLFTNVGAYSGNNEKTRSFEPRKVPRDIAGIRNLIKSLGVQLQVDVVDPLTNETVSVDIMLDGLPNEWPDEIRRKVEILSKRSEYATTLRQFRRSIDRDPKAKIAFVEYCRNLRSPSK